MQGTHVLAEIARIASRYEDRCDNRGSPVDEQIAFGVCSRIAAPDSDLIRSITAMYWRSNSASPSVPRVQSFIPNISDTQCGRNCSTFQSRSSARLVICQPLMPV